VRGFLRRRKPGKVLPHPESAPRFLRASSATSRPAGSSCRLMRRRMKYLPWCSRKAPFVVDRACRAARASHRRWDLLGLTTGKVEPAAHASLAPRRPTHYFSFGCYVPTAISSVDLTKAANRARPSALSGEPLPTRPIPPSGYTPRDSRPARCGNRVAGVVDRRFLGRPCDARRAPTVHSSTSTGGTALHPEVSSPRAWHGNHAGRSESRPQRSSSLRGGDRRHSAACSAATTPASSRVALLFIKPDLFQRRASRRRWVVARCRSRGAGLRSPDRISYWRGRRDTIIAAIVFASGARESRGAGRRLSHHRPCVDGVAIGLASDASPVYISEVAPPPSFAAVSSASSSSPVTICIRRPTRWPRVRSSSLALDARPRLPRRGSSASG